MNRKIHNNAGKSILMALLLLLVAVVVSVVIVTAAVSSVMQIDENRKSQQEYLTVSSAAELIRDCLEEETYTYTENVYTAQRWPYSVIKSESTSSSTANNLVKFIESASDEILNHSDASVELIVPSKQMVITANEMDRVNAEAKIVATGENTYELQVKLETKHSEDSQGYRMRMNLVITKSDPQKSTSTVWYNNNRCNLTTTVTTVRWGKATIAKGWGNEE